MRMRIILCAFCTVTLAPAWAASLDVALQRAVLAGDWATAASRAVAIPNPDSGTRLVAGHAFLATNKMNEALCAFAGATTEADRQDWLFLTANLAKSHPNSFSALYLHADALARQENWNDALAEFTRALDASPGNFLVLNARALTVAALGDWNGARADLATAVKSSRAPIDVELNRGVLAILHRDDSSRTDAYFAAVLKKSPGNAIALIGRGVAAVAERDWKRASDFYYRAGIAAPCITLAAANQLLVQEQLLEEQQRALALASDDAGTQIDRQSFQEQFRQDRANLNSFRNDLGFHSERSLPEIREQLQGAMAFASAANTIASVAKFSLNAAAIVIPTPQVKAFALTGSHFLDRSTNRTSLEMGRGQAIMDRLDTFTDRAGGAASRTKVEAWDKGDWPAVLWPTLLYTVNPIKL